MESTFTTFVTIYSHPAGIDTMVFSSYEKAENARQEIALDNYKHELGKDIPPVDEEFLEALSNTELVVSVNSFLSYGRLYEKYRHLENLVGLFYYPQLRRS